MRAPVRALMISALWISACSSTKPVGVDATTSPTTGVSNGTPLTTAQAVRLSRAFFINYDAGGAEVLVVVPFGKAGGVRLEGTVNWKTHSGQGEIVTEASDGSAPQRQPVWWFSPNDLVNGAIVTTQVGLTQAMAATGRTGVKYLARPIADKSALDTTVRFLDKLASDRAENPVLLRQGDVGFLGAQTIGTTLTDHIRFGSRSTQYWIGVSDANLKQVSAQLSGLAKPTVFTIKALGARTITAPLAAEVVDARQIPDIYQRLLQRKQ